MPWQWRVQLSRCTFPLYPPPPPLQRDIFVAYRKKSSNMWQDLLGGRRKAALIKELNAQPVSLTKKTRSIVETMCRGCPETFPARGCVAALPPPFPARASLNTLVPNPLLWSPTSSLPWLLDRPHVSSLLPPLPFTPSRLPAKRGTLQASVPHSGRALSHPLAHNPPPFRVMASDGPQPVSAAQDVPAGDHRLSGHGLFLV